MILMQAGYSLLASESPHALLYFAIGIGSLVILLFIGALVNRRRMPTSPDEQAKYSHFVFRRTARSMGLPNSHAETLGKLVQACKLRQPFLVFSSSGLLDDVLRKGLYSIENSRSIPEEEKERRKSVLFEIKQIIEANARKGTTLKTTHFLKPGQALTLTLEGGGHFPSKLISNMKDFLSVAAPPEGAASSARWMRGTKLSVYFWRENDAGYSFLSKVLGYDTVRGQPCVLIQHGKALAREQRRTSKRRQILRACFYYPIRIAEAEGGRKNEKKAVVESHLRSLGTVVDLSAGGCAIQSLSPFEPGKLIMVEFDIDKKAPIRAFGKVKRVRRLKGRGGIMHIMFTRVTRQYLNRIRSFVYDFSKPPAGSVSMEGAPQRTASSSAPTLRPRPPR